MNPNNEIERPSYYSITPATIRYDKRLKMAERVMFSEIAALCNDSGYCTTANNYFADLYQVNKATVSRWINHLKELDYVRTEVYVDPKLGNRRRIYPNMSVIVFDSDQPISATDKAIRKLVSEYFSGKEYYYHES
ncbi:helix-turn-helix domain-containing protein [Limosilactobacillus mucosae]|uniref:Helix-turn-helix domain-containing protein n=2 Tax=Limosilactobacillus mucosae TaxID=97478 RepID=A0A0R1P0D2_LIMMU|nr:helix-turn-helix domain-containing protein [Limosilactobacillus mucosae]KRL25695.1 hypothetical protein FC47_GL000227 [Limosilactobacillus mucosae DSM 13345]QOL69355.1 helix-turn-helix domain-containing protein [Limosilactobacillus mucosae]